MSKREPMSKDRPKSGTKNRIAEQIEEIIARGEYGCYGLRSGADWSSEHPSNNAESE